MKAAREYIVPGKTLNLINWLLIGGLLSISILLPELALAGGNTSGGGSDDAILEYLDYSLPKQRSEQNAVASKVQAEISKLTPEQLYRKIKSEFYEAGKRGFKKIEKRVKDSRVFVDHTSAQKFILKTSHIEAAKRKLEEIAGRDSNSNYFDLASGLTDEKNRSLLARNWPEENRVEVNFELWLTLNHNYSSSRDSRLLQEAIAVHEILSLKPLRIEYNRSYSVSFAIIAYHSNNARYIHQKGLLSESDIFGMGFYDWRKLEEPEAEDQRK